MGKLHGLMMATHFEFEYLLQHFCGFECIGRRLSAAAITQQRRTALTASVVHRLRSRLCGVRALLDGQDGPLARGTAHVPLPTA